MMDFLQTAGKRFEELEASIAGGMRVIFSHATVDTLEILYRYRDLLKDQLALSVNAIEEQQTYMNAVADLANTTEEEINETVFEADADGWDNYMDELDSNAENQFRLTEDQLSSDVLLMEQLCIVNQNISELQAILDKHEGCFPRIIVCALKNNGVDMQAYFNENILGNHCYKFAEKGDLILDEIMTMFLLYISPGIHTNIVLEFFRQMKIIVWVWYKIILVI